MVVTEKDGAIERSLQNDEYILGIYDIFYYENCDGCVVLSYDDMENRNFTVEELDEIKRVVPIVKSDLWKHEKETRIIIQLTDESVKRVGIHNELFFIKIKKFGCICNVIYGPIVDKDIKISMEVGYSNYSGMVGTIPKSEPLIINMANE